MGLTIIYFMADFLRLDLERQFIINMQEHHIPLVFI